jgi:hypothetical protein
MLEGSVLEVSTWGYVTVRLVQQAEQAIAGLLADAPGRCTILADMLGADSFEPGVPAAIIGIVMRNRARVVRAAVVATLRPILAVAATFSYLVPGIPYCTFSSRSAALAFLREAPPRRTRTRTPPRLPA